MQRRRQDIVGRIEHVHAAVLELGEVLRLEDDVPAVDPAVAAQRLARLLDVVADAGRAPHVVDGVGVAGIVAGQPLRDLGPHIGEVRQLGLVQLLKNAGLDLALEEIGRRHHHVVAGLAGQQLGLQRVVGIEGIVARLDPGLLAEFVHHLRSDIVGPVVHVDDPLCLRLGSGRHDAHGDAHGGRDKGEADRSAHGWDPQRQQQMNRALERMAWCASIDWRH